MIRSVNVVLSALRVADAVGFSVICKPQVDGSNPSVGSIPLPHRTAMHGHIALPTDFPLISGLDTNWTLTSFKWVFLYRQTEGGVA